MNTRTYARILLSQWQCVAFFTLVGMIVAAGICLIAPPQFTATAEIFLSTPRFNNAGSANTSPFQSDAFTQQRARSYVELATKDDLAKRVITKLGIDMQPAELAEKTTASVLPDTVLIDVSVASPSPSESRILTDAVTEELMRNITTLESRGGLGVPVVEPILTQAAETPEKPSEPNVAVYVLYGAALGFLVGITLATWLDSRRIDDARIEAITGRPILGRPLQGRVDSRSATDDALARRHLREWREIARSVGAEIERTGDKVLMISAADQLTASSDTAKLLASAFAQTGSSVVLLSPQANSPDSSARGLSEVLAGDSSIGDELCPSSQQNLWHLRYDSAIDSLRSDEFHAAIDELRRAHDLVIVDTMDCPSDGQSTLLHDVSDSLILVVRDGHVTPRKLSAQMTSIAKHHVPLLGSLVSSETAGRHRTTTWDIVDDTKGADR